jgi:thymidylate synthase (FAD)
MSKKVIETEVLDKGFVRYIDHLGSDLRIVEAARVSYRSPSKGEEADKKLLKYLYTHKHTSPFEQCLITFNIKLPLFVQAQMVRHRTQKLNQVSARYTKMEPEFYYPEKWRFQDTKNKQGSVWNKDTFIPYNPMLVVPHFDDRAHMGEGDTNKYVREFCEYSYGLYNSMIESGIAREMARMILPQNLYTEIYTTWDLHNLIHFLKLRLDNHAQWEIREYAKAMYEIMSKLFPTVGGLVKEEVNI